ncbi:winged helix-turn-helix domain-containing protein [Erythrobacter rubeus]|uniref:Winged helix-turn-helix domain-containing protein n=1 Tax=Erythrobacter rubeus TaxID=2760803 RepID=A0ABR8KS15_9SPHN|nr:winged helix-turn-helix domain-containing protein [Erythrobacter rubeus]MBD2842135.1 winged helix-turn-helix domain-containing protein [Erythrobacter rubeus]
MQYVLNDVIIDTEARSVWRGTRVIRLSDLSFDTLLCLVRAAPEPVSNSVLAQAVWNAEHVSDETVSQRIALLRKALGDDPKNPIYIRTVRGSGYAIASTAGRLETKAARRKWPSLKAPQDAAATYGLASVLIAVVIFFVAPDIGSETAQDTSEASKASEVSLLVTRANQQLGLHQSVETHRAIAMLRDALHREPDNFDARLTLSFALSTKATKFGGGLENKEEAEALARALIEERPEDSNAWSALGYTLGSQGRMNESLSALQYAYQLDPDNAPAGSSAAYVLLVQGQLYQALDLEFQVLAAGGRSRYAEIQIAQSLELIDHPAAERWRKKALTLNPGQVVVLSEIARSHLRNGRASAALEALEQAKGDDRSAPSILQLKGRAKIALGHVDDARRALEAAGWKGQYDLAALDAMAGRKARAGQLLSPSKLSELDSDPDPEFRIQLAEVFAALGENEEAKALMAQAVNLGWRDIKWLEQSPFLEEVIGSIEWQDLEDRIMRELIAQRRLTEGNTKLALAIKS